VDTLLAFGAALLALRLSGDLAARFRERRAPELAAWAASLLAYALACSALAWAAAAGWDDRAFRAYYLFGGLLTVPLLAAGSLLRAGRRFAGPVALLYAGLAVGLALAMPIDPPVAGAAVPSAAAHLDFVPARLVALLANILGTAIAAGVALITVRRRPLGNALILAGLAAAGAGSALAERGEGSEAAAFAAAALLLYGGFRLSSVPRLRLRARAYT